MYEYHKPVLLKESVDALVSSPDGIYADATFGGGGHSREILSRLSEKGRLIAFDRDEDALKGAFDDPRFKLIHNNFRFIHNYSLLETESGFDGVLADLGVSSMQIDNPERGFSYKVEELAKIFRIYGEVENAYKLASLIVSKRALSPIGTTGDLDKAIESVTPKFAQHKYLAKVYQALRIEVNQEMRSLEKFLEGATKALKSGGKLAVITYHSLEDRMVKNFIKSGNVDGEVEKDVFGRSVQPLEAVNRKPILPLEEEISENTRARSAKLRIAVKR